LAVARGRVGVTSPCRDCSVLATSPIGRDRCDACGSPRQVNHATLHIPVDRPRRLRRLLRHGRKTGASRSCRSPGDCQWRQAPGRARVARLYGVRSAMPMLKALAACPDAELIRPDMAKYSEIGRAVRAEMPRPTPLVEPVSCLGSVNAHGPARARRGRAHRQRRCSGALDLGRTTLPEDTADAATLAYALWPLCERVSARLKQASLAGRTITLKLKTADFARARAPVGWPRRPSWRKPCFAPRRPCSPARPTALPVSADRGRGGRSRRRSRGRPADHVRPRTRSASKDRAFAPGSETKRCGSARPVALPRGAIAAQQRELTGSSRESGQQFGLTSGSISSSLARIE
jgi:hypothetical protein